MANSVAARGVLLSGSKTVTTAGTAEALATTATTYRWLKIVAKTSNTGQVYIGGSDVDSSTNSGLDPSGDLQLFSDKGFDLRDIYLDVGTNGEGVDFYAWN